MSFTAIMGILISSKTTVQTFTCEGQTEAEKMVKALQSVMANGSHGKVKYMHLIETDTGRTDISIFYP